MVLESAGPVLLEGSEELVQPSVHPKLNELYLHWWSTPDARQCWDSLLGRIRHGGEGAASLTADVSAEAALNISAGAAPSAAGLCKMMAPQQLEPPACWQRPAEASHELSPGMGSGGGCTGTGTVGALGGPSKGGASPTGLRDMPTGVGHLQPAAAELSLTSLGLEGGLWASPPVEPSRTRAEASPSAGVVAPRHAFIPDAAARCSKRPLDEGDSDVSDDSISLLLGGEGAGDELELAAARVASVCCSHLEPPSQPAKRAARTPSPPSLEPPLNAAAQPVAAALGASVFRNGAAARQQQAALAAQELDTLHALLDRRGFCRTAPISLHELGELLPMLPGGGVTLYLRRVLWKQLSAGASREAGDSAAGRGFEEAALGMGMHMASEQAPGLEPAPQVAPSVDDFVSLFARRLAGIPAQRRLAACLCETGVSDHVTVAELVPVLEEVLALHPGLSFLHEAPDFQQRYAQTVLVRIFYEHDPLRTGKISEARLQRSRLGEALLSLERTAAEGATSINAELRYFSYEHFYVIFCAFCELDKDHDMLLSLGDLLRYANGALSRRAAERVYAAREQAASDGPMGYDDFMWFILSEEHAQSATALSYWFRLLDLDGDGHISAHEMSFFYEEQAARQQILGQDPVRFADVMRQLLDAVKPRVGGRISLADLRRSKMGALLVHTLTNIHKFVTGELQTAHTPRTEEEELHTQWDHFARAEYERLSIEDDEEEDPSGLLYADPSAFGCLSASGAAESPF